MTAKIAALAVVLMASFGGAAQSPSNSDDLRYRVKDYVPLPPWNSYPDQSDAWQWDCFDDAAKLAVVCSASEGPLERYRHVFQRTKKPGRLW